MEVRILDEQAVEAAEFARKNNLVEMAAEIATIGLGGEDHFVTTDEVSHIDRDPYQRAILVCLARIQVDSLKSAANRQKFPRKTASLLMQAGRTRIIVYRNPDLRRSLQGIDQDHRGREHLFLPEMARDEAKTLQAAAVLFPKQRSRELLGLAQARLIEAQLLLPQGHPLGLLIGIEHQLINTSQGNKLNLKTLLEYFKQLVDTTSETNPHRVATVASWLGAWGEKLGLLHLAQEGRHVLGTIVSSHPEWSFMLESEKRRLDLQKRRELLFRLVTPFTTSAQDRQLIYKSLTTS